MEDLKWVAHCDYEDATIYSCGVKFESGHSSDCGCAMFYMKRNSQEYLIAQLEKFIERNEAVIDDARVRIAQIQASIEADRKNKTSWTD